MRLRDSPDGVDPVKIIDHARAHHAWIVPIPRVLRVSMDSHSNRGLVQLHGVGRKGDRDI